MTSLPAFLDAHGTAIQVLACAVVLFSAAFVATSTVRDWWASRPARPARKHRSF